MIMTNDRQILPVVRGRCPMGCGETLFLAEGGYVTCSLIGCPRPDAATGLLEIRESEHIAYIEHSGFTLEHPLRERLEFALNDCPLTGWMHSLDEAPADPGRYRVTSSADGVWTFDRTEETDHDH